jgi:signal transduction histidine kinase
MPELSGAATEAALPVVLPPSSTLRWLLLVICGALLALLCGSGLVAVQLLEQMYGQQQAVTHELAARTQMLSGLWLSIQNYNQAVQQFVTQANAAQASAEQNEKTRQRLDQLTLEIDEGLKRYPSNRDPAETALLDGMQDVFYQQRTFYISVLEAKPEQRRREARNLISQNMVPLQKQTLDWSERLRTWNGQRLQQADQSMVREFGALQGRLSRTLTISFGSGLLLMLVSMAYILRLERQTQSRYVQLARSQRELQRLSARLLDAQETERRSISRELHDEVGQSLGALLVDIGRLAAAAGNQAVEFRAQLDNMKAVTERTVREVRNMALLLRPSMLDDLGLAAALEWQGREISRRSEIEVAVESDNVPEDLPDEYKICIYRLVQEALNNAVRHSGARNAKVRVEHAAGSIAVRVSDDGRGFDPERTRGLGILGMEERVKRLGGTFTVESKRGQGVTVRAGLPMPGAIPNSI